VDEAKEEGATVDGELAAGSSNIRDYRYLGLPRYCGSELLVDDTEEDLER
jgi:hypothetical protein